MSSTLRSTCASASTVFTREAGAPSTMIVSPSTKI